MLYCCWLLHRSRRNALPRECPEFGLRLSLFCFRPIAYDAFVLRRQPQLSHACAARPSPSPSPPPRSCNSSSSNSSSSNSSSSNNSSSMAVEGEAAAEGTTTGRRDPVSNRLDLLSFCLAEQLPDDVDGFLELQWTVPAAADDDNAAAGAAADSVTKNESMAIDFSSDSSSTTTTSSSSSNSSSNSSSSSSSSNSSSKEQRLLHATRTVRLFCSELLLPGYSHRTVPHPDGTASSCCSSSAAPASPSSSSSSTDCCSSGSRDCSACGALEAHCQALVRKYNIPPQHHPVRV